MSLQSFDISLNIGAQDISKGSLSMPSSILRQQQPTDENTHCSISVGMPCCSRRQIWLRETRPGTSCSPKLGDAKELLEPLDNLCIICLVVSPMNQNRWCVIEHMASCGKEMSLRTEVLHGPQRTPGCQMRNCHLIARKWF